MKRLIAIAAVAVSLAAAYPDLQRPVMTDTERESYTAGQLILELTPAQRGKVSITTEDGIARFDIPALDELNRRWHVDEVAPLWRRPNPGPIAMQYGCDVQYLIQFDVDQDIRPVAAEYEALAEVEYTCPNAWFPLTDVPNDTLFDYQWHLANIGAPAAWEFAHGDSTVLIGVLDDGCEWHHPDIIDNLWVNALEDLNGNGRFDRLPPPDGDIDGLDQDGNGYPDDVIGYDFAVADPNPDPNQLSDDHGTHCWGISNARTDNAIGVAGVPWNVRNFGYRCGGGGGISLYAAIAAIYHLVPKDGFVISMSFGGYSPYQPMADACQFAWESGLVLVGGAGNDGTSNIFYPANYDHVISVAASGPNDMKTSWSNYGTWIEVTAPGAGIYATVTNHGYGAKSGTSMSTPLVAGAIAWIKSPSPTSTTHSVAACSTRPATRCRTTTTATDSAAPAGLTSATSSCLDSTATS